MELWYGQWKAHTVHPNLRVRYFHTIDTKEKAYWLGFMFADGYITEDHNGGMLIRLELSRRDIDVINRFCNSLGLEKGKKEYQRHRKTESVAIRFKCKAMSGDLLRQGLVLRKSDRIEYPKSLRRDLELAFLPGYLMAMEGRNQLQSHVATGAIWNRLRADFAFRTTLWRTVEKRK